MLFLLRRNDDFSQCRFLENPKNSPKKRHGFWVRFHKTPRGLLFFARPFFEFVILLTRWLCQVFEPNPCFHCSSAIATGANGASRKKCFLKRAMAVYTSCITATLHQSSLYALLQMCHLDFFWWCKRSPCYGCNSSVSTCGLFEHGLH